MTSFPLRITGIAKRFGPTVALDGVDIELRRGEVHALIGENGAGKSTLLGILAGAVKPDCGAMERNGSVYAPDSPLVARRAGVALIHQELSLCAHLSVQENVLLGAELSRYGVIDRVAMRARARAILEELPHPEIRPERLVRELSLPARQIVEICRALAADADVILMDEPTSSLQGADVERLFALVRRLAERQITVVYISHFLEEVQRIADRYTVLRDGRSVATGDMRDASVNELISMMVGRETSAMFPARTARATGEIALSVRGLSAPPCLSDASFELHRGEILGIGGLIGSGRTELVRALFGLDQVSGGMVKDGDGLPIDVNARPRIRVQRGFGFLSEDRKGEGLALPLSIADNVCATKPARRLALLGALDIARQRESASRWMTDLRVRAQSPSQQVRALSGGNQQKIAFARLLHQDAQVLLLDEPTRGVDIGSRAEIYRMIAQRADEGRAILLVSSYLPELFGLCDRIAVMCRGRLSPARPVADWTPEQVMASAVGS